MSLPDYLTSSPPPVAAPTTVRLQALYASTSAQRQSNPTGYSANVSWWSSLIEELLRSGYLGEDHLSIKVDESLLGKLEWNGGRPKGIGGVVERLSSSAPPLLHTLPHFLTSATPLHAQASLSSRFIGRPLWWALSQLIPFGSTDEAVIKEDTLWTKFGKGKEYVHMPLLEQSAAVFTNHMKSNPAVSYSESLYSLSSFSESFDTICFPRRKDGKTLKEERLSPRDMELLIKWLNRDCGAIVTDGDVIKVLAEGEKAQDHPITEADKGTVTLRATLKRLEQQIESIEKQIERCQQKAKHHLSLSQKPIAISHLKSKRALEDILLKRISTSQTLQAVLQSIDQAKGDIEIMAAYEQSTSSLKSILSHPSLELGHVERTTDELAEVMAGQEEVDSAIRLGGEIAVAASGRGGEEVDDEELKKELEAMVEDQRQQDVASAEAKAKENAKAEKEREKKEAEEQRAKKESVKQPQSQPPPPVQNNTEGQERSRAEQDELEDIKRRYEDAQQRQRDEAARAEVERMRKADRERERMAAAAE